MADLSRLTRYYVVDKHGNPVTAAPYKQLLAAKQTRDYRNTADVLGFASGRPHRVIALIPQELPNG